MQYSKNKNLKKRWIKNHILKLITISIIIFALYVMGGILNNYLIIGFNTIFAFISYLYIRNKMMSYVEKELYDKS